MAVLAAAVLTAGMVLAAGENDVLYWMVDDSATITTDTESGATATIGRFFENVKSYSPFENLNTGEGSAFAARIRVTGGDITEPVFLMLHLSDGTTESGELGIWLGDNGAGYWGAGVPTGNQSPVGDYAVGTPEYNFIVEIGNVQWNETLGTASWIETIAASAAVP